MSVPITLLLAVQVAQAGVAGTVRDEMTGDPLSGAVVTMPELSREAVTGPDGRFGFWGLEPGPHHIFVERLGFASRTLHALVPRSGTVSLDVSLVAAPLELGGLVVQRRLPVRGVEKGAARPAGPRGISLAAARNHPMLAEVDALHALEGADVSAMPESPIGVHVRGGSASQTTYELDGIPVLNPLHAAGLFSAWNPDALAGVTLDRSVGSPLPSLSGAVAARTRTPGARTGGAGALSTSQARFSVDGPLGESAGYLVGLRSGYPGSLGSVRDPARVRGEVGDFVGRADVSLRGGVLRLLAYGTEDELSTGVVADGSAGPTPDARNGFGWRAQALGVGWSRETSTGGVEVRAWDSRAYSSVTLGPSSSERADVGGRRIERGARGALDLRWGGDGALRLSARAGRTSTRYAVNGARSSEVAGAVTSAALGAGLDAPLPAGVRLAADVELMLAGGKVYGSPVVSASVEPSRGWSLSATVSRRHQLVQSLRNEESLLGTVFPAELSVVAGSGGVPVARADEIEARVEHRPTPGVALGLQAFARRLGSVVFVAPSTGALYADGAFDVGSVEARGASLDASFGTARWTGVLDVVVQEVENRSSTASYVPSYSPTARLQAGIVAYLTATTSLRVAHTGLWGRRATALTGPVEWESCNLLDGGCELAGAPDHGTDLGGARPGAYHRTDIGVRKHWHLHLRGRDAMVTAYGTVTNVFGRSNVMSYALDPAGDTQVPIHMLPLSPLVIGFELAY